MRLGDYGTTLRAQFLDEKGDALDLTSLVTRTILITDPAGTETTFTATIPSGKVATDGQLEYKTLTGDVSTTVGDWTWKARATDSATEFFTTRDFKFTVD